MNRFCMAAGFIFTVLGSSVYGQAILVQDIQANLQLTKGFAESVDASRAAGTQVSTAIENQNKTMANIYQALSMIETQNSKAIAAIAEKRQNAERYDPSMGAIAPTSCNVYKGTASMAVGDKSRTTVRQSLKRASDLHHERAKFNHPGEAQNLGSAYRLIHQMEAADKLELESGKPIEILGDGALAGGPGTETDLNAYVNKVNNVINPFPKELPADYASKSQTPEKATVNAGKRIFAERMKLASGELSRHAADRISVYDNTWIKELVSATSGGEAGQEQLAQLGEFSTRMESLEILYKHRSESPSWQVMTGGSTNPVGLARDMNLMLAQSLGLQFDAYVESRRTNELLALIYAQMVETSGVPKPDYSQK